jgi:hypothetical protein
MFNNRKRVYKLYPIYMGFFFFLIVICMYVWPLLFTLMLLIDRLINSQLHHMIRMINFLVRLFVFFYLH